MPSSRPAAQVIAGRLVDVERERLVVFAGVPHGQAAVQALDQQQLGPGRRGGQAPGAAAGPGRAPVRRADYVREHFRTSGQPAGSCPTKR